VQIGFICVGHMGGTVARHWAKLGHDVRIANSRGPGTLTATGKNRVVVLARDKLSALKSFVFSTLAIRRF
jgi:Predicted dinucleotide-binding enzymes